MLVLYAVFAYVLRYTAWGAHVYAVGDDPDAARLAGIQVQPGADQRLRRGRA